MLIHAPVVSLFLFPPPLGIDHCNLLSLTLYDPLVIIDSCFYNKRNPDFLRLSFIKFFKFQEYSRTIYYIDIRVHNRWTVFWQLQALAIIRYLVCSSRFIIPWNGKMKTIVIHVHIYPRTFDLWEYNKTHCTCL